MIKLKITDDDSERHICLAANTMKELIDEKLPRWLPYLEENLPLLRQTKRFKADPEGEEQKERDSGWWYDC